MNWFLLASSIADASGNVSSGGDVVNEGNYLLESLMSFAPIIIIFVVFWFFLIRPQRKKEKEVQKMRSCIEVGDEIVTIGGIMGIVTNVKEDVLVIETGADRSKVRIAKWAVQENLTIHDTPAE